MQHGQEILDHLSAIKRSLVTRFDHWQEGQSSTSASDTQSAALTPTTQEIVSRVAAHDLSPSSSAPISPASTPSSYRSRSYGHSRTPPSPFGRSMQDDEAARQAREEAIRRDQDRRREDERSRYAAVRGNTEPSISHEEDWAMAERMRLSREQETRRQQDEMRKREEEIRRRKEDVRKQEQDGIARRQHEAEVAYRAARGVSDIAMPQPSSSTVMTGATFPSSTYGPQTDVLRAGQSNGILQLPLESPTRCVCYVRSTG